MKDVMSEPGISKPILSNESLKDYDRAHINTKPNYRQYINSGFIIPFYTPKEGNK